MIYLKYYVKNATFAMVRVIVITLNNNQSLGINKCMIG
jgi:hypothetical protein